MRGVPLTPEQRQQIIDLRKAGHVYKKIARITGRPYNTISHICRDEGLQHEPEKVILIVCDPSDTYKIGPTELNQADLAYILALADPPDGFAFTIGHHRITTQDGIYVRDDGCYCPPNQCGKLKWYKPARADTADRPKGAT